MKEIFKLKFNKKFILTFGILDLPKEIKEMFGLRYEVYSNKNYIDPLRYPEREEFDNYDLENRCTYFGVIIENNLVASARLIRDKYLPTEIFFKFKEPAAIERIPREKRGEISRLVASYNIDPNTRPPRLIFTLGLIKAILDYSLEKDILGGYSFIKSSLLNKLVKLKVPIHLIKNYTQRYPQDGPLFKYFNDPSDPVFPVYYLRNEFVDFIQNIFNNRVFFSKIAHNFYELNDNLYVRLIKKLKFI